MREVVPQALESVKGLIIRKYWERTQRILQAYREGAIFWMHTTGKRWIKLLGAIEYPRLGSRDHGCLKIEDGFLWLREGGSEFVLPEANTCLLPPLTAGIVFGLVCNLLYLSCYTEA